MCISTLKYIGPYSKVPAPTFEDTTPTRVGQIDELSATFSCYDGRVAKIFHGGVVRPCEAPAIGTTVAEDGKTGIGEHCREAGETRIQVEP